MDVFTKIEKLFKDSGVEFEVIDHEPVFTSAEAAKVRGTDISNGAKALVLIGDGKPMLFVVPGDCKANFAKIKKELSISDLRMATPEEVETLTALKIGSIPPVGKAINLPSHFDLRFTSKDKITFNAGLHTRSVIMKSSDLIKAEEPRIMDIV